MLLFLALALCLLLCLAALARMRVYGLTGGIACGKSTVSAILASRGFHIVDADLIAHEILKPGTAAYSKVLAAFGHDILAPTAPESRANGSPMREIDRAKLRDIVFRDSSKRKRLNAITHPAIAWRIFCDIARHRLLHWSRRVVLDAPLLFESGLDRICHTTIAVDVDPQVQLQRICRRDRVDEESARRVVAAQMPSHEKAKRATHVIDNTSTLADLHQRVSDLVRVL
jgi:dephospho-CoA kinase